MIHNNIQILMENLHKWEVKASYMQIALQHKYSCHDRATTYALLTQRQESQYCFSPASFYLQELVL